MFLPAATKLGQGNIFRIVCQEFCPQGGSPNFFGGGVSNFSGGLQNFFLFFQFLFPPKNSFWDTPPPPQDGQCMAGTHPTGMHSCYTCLSFCSQEGSASVRAGIPPPPQSRPHGADTPGDQASPRADTSWEQTHSRTRHPAPGTDPLPPPPTPTHKDSYCCGRYASYWNAFLFTDVCTYGYLLELRAGFGL